MLTTEIKLEEFDNKIRQLMFESKIKKKNDEPSTNPLLLKNVSFMVQQKVKNSLNEKLRLQKI